MEYVWVLTIVFGLLSTVAVFLVKVQFNTYKDKNDAQDRKICELEAKVHDIELVAKTLDTRLWPEKKLVETIQTTVKNAMTESIKDMYEKGILSPTHTNN